MLTIGRGVVPDPDAGVGAVDGADGTDLGTACGRPWIF